MFYQNIIEKLDKNLRKESMSENNKSKNTCPLPRNKKMSYVYFIRSNKKFNAIAKRKRTWNPKLMSDTRRYQNETNFV